MKNDQNDYRRLDAISGYHAAITLKGLALSTSTFKRRQGNDLLLIPSLPPLQILH